MSVSPKDVYRYKAYNIVQELTERTVDSSGIFKHTKPNLSVVIDGITYVTNFQGIRNERGYKDKTPNQQKIVCVGTSNTLGVGVELKDTYAKILEKMLDQEGGKVEVIPMGDCGKTTYQALVEREKVASLKPDVAILDLGINDGWLTSLSYWNRLRRLRGEDVKEKGFVPNFEIGEFQEYYTELIKFLKYSGHVILLTQAALKQEKPIFNLAEADLEWQFEVYRQISESIRDIGATSNVSVVDLERRLGEEHFAFDGIHLNVAGHNLVAKLLHNETTKMLNTK